MSRLSQREFVADPQRWQYRYPLRHRIAAAWKEKAFTSEDTLAVERAAAKMLRRPEKAAEMMAAFSEDQRRTVALSWALTELEEEFKKADADQDGKVTYGEFKRWVMNVIETGPQRDAVSDPSRRQLCYVAIGSLVPFVCFGMVDNGLMVIYGDVIDGTLGLWLGFSMLASAALGNAFSNIFGMLSHGTISKWSDKMGLPDPHITTEQRKLPKVHYWSTAGSTVGVFIGCLLGMTPLLFMNQTEKEEQRSSAKTH